jgi:hypothetical protein
MQQAEQPPLRKVTAAGLGAAFISVLAAGIGFLVGAGYQSWQPLLLAALMIALSLPAIRRQARREGNWRLANLILFALIAKLCGAMAREFVAFEIYGGVADAAGYHGWGIKISNQFWSGEFSTGLESLTGANFIRFATGVIYTVIGQSRLGGFLLFSWLGFWGLFLFYRAFAVASPEAARRRYAPLIFFLPSLIYWPSSIGKEAWMMFALGISAYGAAQALNGRSVRGMMVAGMGMSLAALVRPHVAGMVGVALVVGYVIRKPRIELRQLAPVVKGLSLSVAVVVAGILVARTDQFLRTSNIDTSGGVGSVLTDVSERTGQGGSEFAPSILKSPLRAPIAVPTVLFRPLMFDAHNAQSLIAAVEGTFLLLLTIVRFPRIVGALRSLRRDPYVAFAFGFVGLFVIAFSSVANFGLLARERVQLLPFYLVLLCLRFPARQTLENDEIDSTQSKAGIGGRPG